MTQRGVPGANGSPDTVILQGQWAGAIVADESSWTLEEGKLVLDIRKRVDADWKVRCRRVYALGTPGYFFSADSHLQRHQWRRFAH
jgi:hypothetical protein